MSYSYSVLIFLVMNISPTLIPVSVLLNVLKASILEDETVIAPGRIRIIHSIQVHMILQEFCSHPGINTRYNIRAWLPPGIGSGVYTVSRFIGFFKNSAPTLG